MVGKKAIKLVLQCCDAVGWAAGRAPGLQKTERWGAGMVICLEQGADLHMAQLVPLPLTIFCSSKIQIGFTFLVPAHPGSPGQRAIKQVCVVHGYIRYFVCQIMQRPTTENKQKLVSLSKNVAATMTEIIQAAEAIKGWSPLSVLNPLC